ncbi:MULTISPECIES: DUF3000 domain-containing protein [unclassified Microbacterium]|uniref:DUF3000 domain-containing protein n=1 Tax=unclassified Microbacterium TaxID=2609290 RepID=UPI001604EEE9|nr:MULTISPECIES: DUF3000 domain-containing protein [unclassified Microbacterium]QNA92720.1 DUF3000 domain-containing protein [Microbacterium sp. Se63.02b]QYM62858.1 DUF3000 domain-containing protein [Microbacterium sp. Se5.02b]
MTAHPEAGTPFDSAVTDLRETVFRDDITVREIATPQGLAPFAHALAADVRPEGDGESVYGTGRFVLLHDPEAPGAWGGPWRIVVFAQAPLETEIGTDPLLADVTWSWLVDALDSRGAIYHSASGTSTKTLSKGFGGLAVEGDGAQIELRASWTPEGPIRPHVEAWAELVGMLAGLPPGSEGIAVIGARKAVRD